MCKYIRKQVYGKVVNTILSYCMLKASKAQVHIFIQLFSQLSVIYIKSNLRFYFLLEQPALLHVLETQ